MLLVGNGRMITRDLSQPFLENGCLAIKGQIIVDVGNTEAMRAKYPAERFLDAREKIIMPGLINSHMHLYSTFARGMALKDEPPGRFSEILERLWWRLDKALTLEDVYYSAIVPLIDCIKNGTTTIFDHHASPGAVRDSLFTIAQAAREIGVRSCLSYEVSDRDGRQVMEEGICENAEFIAHCWEQDSSMLRGMFGLHASMTLSDETLKECANIDRCLCTGFHVHTAEGIEDVEDSLARSGLRVVERLHQFEVLGPRSIAVHCVHINEREMELLQQSGTTVIHNPESNMGNAVGCAPVLKMLDKGIQVGLGTDGYTTDMLESLKVANLLHKHQQKNPSVFWSEPHQMLFENNKTIASNFFGQSLGVLSPNSLADVIIVDYYPPTPLTENNVNGHLLFGISGRQVETTIVNGKIVMENRVLVGIDEEEIMAKSREQAANLWKRF